MQVLKYINRGRYVVQCQKLASMCLATYVPIYMQVLKQVYSVDALGLAQYVQEAGTSTYSHQDADSTVVDVMRR